MNDPRESFACPPDDDLDRKPPTHNLFWDDDLKAIAKNGNNPTFGSKNN